MGGGEARREKAELWVPSTRAKESSVGGLAGSLTGCAEAAQGLVWSCPALQTRAKILDGSRAFQEVWGFPFDMS